MITCRRPKQCFFPENCKWSPWSQWSSCSKICGNGASQRGRTIVKYEKYGGRKCYGSKQERRACNNHECKFHLCLKKWCYQKGTKQQYTKCKSVSKDGNTCYQPEIRYGSTVGGYPGKHPSTDNILQWCKQLFPTSSHGTATYSNSRKLNIGKPVFWQKGYDETGYKWADWNGGHWKDSTLDYSLRSSCNAGNLYGCRMTSVTCQGMYKNRQWYERTTSPIYLLKILIIFELWIIDLRVLKSQVSGTFLFIFVI